MWRKGECCKESRCQYRCERMSDTVNYNNRRGEGIKIGILLFCLGLRMSPCYAWQLRAEKLPVLTTFLLVFRSSLSSLSPQVVAFFLPSLPVIYHRYSGIYPQGAAGGAERCKVHFCPPVRACVGPGGRQLKDQDSSIVLTHSSQWRIW